MAGAAVLVVAYSGLRRGEMAALTADRVDVARRRILVDRQVVVVHLSAASLLVWSRSAVS